MSKIPKFEKPDVSMIKNEKFKVKTSQIPPMDVAFSQITLTDYELLVATIRKLNELVAMTNSYTEFIEKILDWVVGDGVELAVKDKLEEWLEDGTLENLINDTLFERKLEKTEFYEWVEDIYNLFVQETYEQFKTTVDNEINRIDDEIEDVTTQLEQIAVNVKKFGAKGDGVTDDTESIQNAIDHVLDNGGGTVLIPNGRYRIVGHVEFGSNMRLLGSGRATIIDGVGGTGGATIRPKEELRGSYNGATDFSLENFAFDSSDLGRQGIYTDNCSRFKIKNFWGLNTPMHYLDINNSIHGRIENVYLHKNVESRGALQIDSLEGINKHIQMDNVLVYSEEGTEHSGIAMHDCAVHLHRDGGEFIDLDGLTVVNVPVGIYTDNSYVLNNSSFKNLNFVNVQRPINYLGSPTAQSNNLTFDYINIVGEHIDRGLLFSDVNKLKISNVNVKVDVSTETHLIRLARSSEVKIGAIDIEGGLKQTNPSHPLYFLSVYQTPDFEFLEKISGEFVPRIVKANKPSEQVDYTTRTGHYTILGKEIRVRWHTVVAHNGAGGEILFGDLPTSRASNTNLISSFGSIGVLKGLKDNLTLRVIKTGIDVVLTKDTMEGSTLQFSDLDTTKDFEISFEMTYKFYLQPS